MSDFRVGAARDLPINADASWDAGAAKASIWEWAGFNGDNPDSSKARKAFLVYDAEAPNLKGSYVLPFARYENGRLEAVAAGLRAAASRLPQADLPDDVQQRARSVLDAYFEKLNGSGSGTNATETDDPHTRLWAVSAPVRAVAGASVDELMALARKAAFDPSIFDDHPPFFGQAQISSNRLDSYFTRMHTSTLQNFAADAAAGVSVQQSHNSHQLGVGRSLTGTYTGGGGNGVQHVTSDFYTVPGLRLNGDLSTDDFIAGIRSGLIHDVSVGFYGGTMACSICGRDIWDWHCPHVPGVEYTGVDAKGNETDPEMAIAWIRDAHLAEYSAVFDGATPGAEILGIKAVREADAGRLRPETARYLTERFRVRLPGSALSHRWAGVTPAGDGAAQRAPRNEEPPRAAEEGEMELTEEQRAHLALGADVAALLAARNVMQENETPAAALTRVLDDLPRLRTLADLGEKYRADLIEAALAEGVRAQGTDFATETYKAILERASIEEIKRFTSDWAAVAARQFPGGRATTEGTDTQQPVKPAPVPDAAFTG